MLVEPRKQLNQISKIEHNIVKILTYTQIPLDCRVGSYIVKIPTYTNQILEVIFLLTNINTRRQTVERGVTEKDVPKEKFSETCNGI